MGTIIVHAGMPKAGSSSIQKWLRAHAVELREHHDVRLVAAVPDASGRRAMVEPRIEGEIKTSELAGLLLRRRDAAAGLLDDLARGLERWASAHSTVVLTGEALAHSFWRPDARLLACLDELAARHVVRVAYYVRPQHEALESAWRQWGFRSGRPPSRYLEERGRGLHYFETHREVGRRAPRVSFEPRPFRRDLLVRDSVATDFAERFLGIGGAAAVAADDPWVNRGLPLALVNILRPAPAGLFWRDRDDNSRLNELKQLVRGVELPSDERVEASRLILRAWCREAYEAGNRRLIEALGWATDSFVAPVDNAAGTVPADLEALDELWEPHASMAELELLWHALDRALEAAPARSGARVRGARPALRRIYRATRRAGRGR